MNQQRKQAFTLVELIVVITILAILGTIAFISLQGYSRDSRDSVRISDVSNMKTSLELFHLDAGKYPMPDDAEEVTFSGGVLWYQGTFGEQVRKNVSRNMAEVPTDPLMDKEYIYSVLNNRNELEILTLLEGDVASISDPQVYAGNLLVTPRIDGNYNGLFVKTKDYIVPVPSIITAEDTSGGLELNANNIKSQVMHLGENVPVLGNVQSSTGALTGVQLSVYTGSITSDSTDEQKVAAMMAIQNAYSGSSLKNEGVIEYILSQTETGALVSLVDSVILGSADVVVSSSSSSTSSTGGPITYNYDFFLDGEGTNGGNNNTFSDSSSNNFTLTKYGNVTQGNFSPLSGGGTSAYFDGAGDMFISPVSTEFGLGTGNFTIEAWAYNSNIAKGNTPVIDFRDSGGTSQVKPTLWFRAGEISYHTAGAVRIQTSANGNQWYHIALTRESAVTRLFVDGNYIGSYADGNDYGSSTDFVIGEVGDNRSYNGFFNGYITDVRILKGTALYNTGFTVPTVKLTNIANTSVLMNFDEAQLVDSSDSKVYLSTEGDTQISTTQKKNGTSSIYFDGVNDRLQSGTSDVYQFGTGDFTVEYWVYPTDFSAIKTISDSRTGGSSTDGFNDYIDTSGKVGLYLSNSNVYLSSTGLSLNTWSHVAIVRESGQISVFINGTQDGSSFANSTNMSNTYFRIGENIAGGGDFAGYIDDLKITKGTAKYSGTFVPE